MSGLQSPQVSVASYTVQSGRVLLVSAMIDLKPRTHAPEIGARNRRHKFDARFWRHFFVPIATSKKKTGADLWRRN